MWPRADVTGEKGVGDVVHPVRAGVGGGTDVVVLDQLERDRPTVSIVVVEYRVPRMRRPGFHDVRVGLIVVVRGRADAPRIDHECAAGESPLSLQVGVAAGDDSYVGETCCSVENFGLGCLARAVGVHRVQEVLLIIGGCSVHCEDSAIQLE